jgi:hypothetical protein
MPVAAFLPAIIAAAGTGIASGVQAHAASSAAKSQEASANQALGLQRDVLKQQQQNISPFLNAGTASLARLNSYLTPQGQAPTDIARATGGPFGQADEILVIAPTGERLSRPASERGYWESKGATIGNGANMQAPASLAGMLNPRHPMVRR